MKFIFIYLSVIIFAKSQTLNDIKTTDLEYFQKFDFWYMSTAAGDSSKHHFKLYKKNLINHKEVALDEFQKSNKFAMQRDRYKLSETSVKLLYVKNLIEVGDFDSSIFAEEELNNIAFENERNVYVKKLLIIISFLRNDLNKLKKKLGTFKE